ncbi:MAG: UTRA domain-containing protein [Atopobium sp.]|nr:UTRA domain-containing protein [Atopobium sp.]
MAIDRHHFLTSEIPGIDRKIATSSLFHYIEVDLGIDIVVSEREITVEKPTAQDRKLLSLEGPIYLAVTHSRTYDSNGVEFEYVEGKYLPQYFHFFDTATRNPLP